MLYEGFFQGTLRCRCDMNMSHDSRNSRDEEQSKKETFFVVMPDCPIAYDLAKIQIDAPYFK